MKNSTLSASLLGLGLITAIVCSTSSFVLARPTPHSNALLAQEHGHEAALEMSKLPDAVKTAAAKILGKLDGCTASMEKSEGTMLYEIATSGSPSTKVTLKMTAAGQVVEIERGIGTDKLPADTLASIQERFPGATIASAEEVEMHYFEVKLDKSGKKLVVSPSGQLWSDEESEEGEEGEEGEEEDGR